MISAFGDKIGNVRVDPCVAHDDNAPLIDSFTFLSMSDALKLTFLRTRRQEAKAAKSAAFGSRGAHGVVSSEDDVPGRSSESEWKKACKEMVRLYHSLFSELVHNW